MDSIKECIICTERMDLFGIGQCGHSCICARCHFKMRAKQQNLNCVYCKELNQYLLITDDAADRLPADPYSLVEFREGCIFFKNYDVKARFEALIASKCPCCPERFDQATEFKEHLKERHWRYLWY